MPGGGEVGHSTLLSSREQEIAEAVAEGHTSADIAANLRLSTRTVENHLQHVYRKLDTSKRAELATALTRYASRTHEGPSWYEPDTDEFTEARHQSSRRSGAV